jgi:glycosyltransferase involved in cell wall biosynthesis
MRILVIAQDYPSNANPYAMSYVHTRCVGYKHRGHEVEVLSFNSKTDYVYDGISIKNEQNVRWELYDRIACHAPNLRNHVRFLKRVIGKRIVFFFHGHEVLRTSDYPAPYSWNKQTKLRAIGRALYDEFKLPLLRRFLLDTSKRNSVSLIFVSQWMKEQFERTLNVSADAHWPVNIVPNPVHDAFLQRMYQPADSFAADFITIRPLDESKYCIDLVTEAARKNPNKTFHVFGRGQYFRRNIPPKNLTWFDKFLVQPEIPDLLNKYRCALMPTRYDAQGVMACEMASFGIPVITSDFEVCVEMLRSFDNCAFLNREAFSVPMSIPPANTNNLALSSATLVARELDFQ